MKTRAIVFLLALLIPALAFGQIGPYTQDFEGLTSAPEDPSSSLGDNGWLYYVNVFNSSGVFLYPYGAGPAPNNGNVMSAVVEGEGGGDQELKQLSIFSDYANQVEGHAAGNLVEVNIYQERIIDASNVGQTWTMTFDAKMGNLDGATTAAAFFKTLNPANNYELTNFPIVDTTTIPSTWAGYSVSLIIDAGLVGQIFQFGFINTASNNEGSGVFYDNVNLSLDGAVATEESSFGSLKALYR